MRQIHDFGVVLHHESSVLETQSDPWFSVSHTYRRIIVAFACRRTQAAPNPRRADSAPSTPNQRRFTPRPVPVAGSNGTSDTFIR